MAASTLEIQDRNFGVLLPPPPPSAARRRPQVSELERPRADGAPNFTDDTLAALQAAAPAGRWALVLGADAARWLPKWRWAPPRGSRAGRGLSDSLQRPRVYAVESWQSGRWRGVCH